ncbi:uncharacterized protein LOC144146847 [Haemaphysalis longicornis]
MRTKTWNLEAWEEPVKTKEEHDESPRAKPEEAEPPARRRKRSAGPDSSLSWFIAALCFMVNLLFSSFLRCSGLFFTSIMSTYDTTRGYASLPLSMYNGFLNLSGLVAGPLIHGFGVRLSAILGGLMMGLGCMSSYFANDIAFLVVSLGVVTGSGQGILLNCVIVAINQYFDKRRGVALGINLAGAPAASFLFPKIFDLLLGEYGFRGTLAITGALLLNIVAISLLFRKPPWEEREAINADVKAREHDAMLRLVINDCPAKGENAESKERVSTDSRKGSIVVSVPGSPASCRTKVLCVAEKDQLRSCRLTVESELSDRFRSSEYIGTDHQQALTKEEEINLARSRRGTLLSVAGSLLEEEKAMASSRRGTVISLTKPAPVVGDIDLRKMALLQEAAERLTRSNVAASNYNHETASLASSYVSEGRCRLHSERSLSEQPTDNAENQIKGSRRGTLVSIGTRCHLEFPDKPHEPLRLVIPEEPHRSALQSAKHVLSLPRFYVHMISYFLFSFYLDTFLGIVVDYATDVGISSESAVLVLTFFSAADAVGRLFVPLLTDYKIVSPLSLMSASYLLMAVIGQTMPYAKNMVLFWTAMITLGLPVGYIMVAASEAIATEVGVPSMPIAFGIVCGLSAVGSFLRPAVIGFYRDT